MGDPVRQRIDACPCSVKFIAKAPGHVCRCGIKWKQQPYDPGGPGRWLAQVDEPIGRVVPRRCQCGHPPSFHERYCVACGCDEYLPVEEDSHG